MEKSNKSRNQKKMAIKFGGTRGGGAIGAVIVFGGVLATGALALTWRKGRSSGKDRNLPPENDNLPEQVESSDDLREESLTPDVESVDVSDDGFVIVDGESSNDEPTDGDDSENYSTERENQEKVHIEEEYIEVISVHKDVDEVRESGDEETMNEKKWLESEVTESGLLIQTVEKLDDIQEKCEEKLIGEIEETREIVAILHEENKVENGCILHQTADGIINEETEFNSEKLNLTASNDEEEIVEEGDAQIVETLQENCNADELVNNQEKHEENLMEAESDSEISNLKTSSEEEEAVEEETQNVETLQENCNAEELVNNQEKCDGYTLHQTTDEITNEEAEFDADRANLERSEEKEEVLVKESSVGNDDFSTEPNSETVWPAESAEPELVHCRVGKSEDQAVTEERTYINKYSMVMDMVMKKDTNPGWWRLAIAISTMLISLSCSWFFGLSSAKFMVIAFIMVFIASEIYGF